jgi:hypothetical protein
LITLDASKAQSKERSAAIEALVADRVVTMAMARSIETT